MCKKYACPCCGELSLDEEPPGTYLVCAICNWEDDPVQYFDPTYAGGANTISLIDAQNLYRGELLKKPLQ